MKKLITRLCVLGLLTMPAFAANSQTNDPVKTDSVSAETQSIKKQIAQLQHEVAALKKQKKHKAKHYSVIPPKTVAGTMAPAIPRDSEDEGTDMDRLVQTYLQSLPLDWDNPGQSFVSIGPYVNVPIKFSGNNLI